MIFLPIVQVGRLRSFTGRKARLKPPSLSERLGLEAARAWLLLICLLPQVVRIHPMYSRSQQRESVAGTHRRCFRSGLAADPPGMCQDPGGHFHKSLHLHKVTHLHSREAGPSILKHPILFQISGVCHTSSSRSHG